ncbi:MAG: M14 family metallopeptidase [Bryobacterales bacterium]|nr:M14 family metallopeptidase [Bryobacterales bacterium]
MRSRTLPRCLALCVLFVSVALGQITEPRSHFGFTPGDDYKLANYEQIRSYFELLARQSDRVQVVDIGQTSEGRPTLMAYISSPENLGRLEEYRQIQRKLALAQIPEGEAKALAAQAKAIVWIDCSMHSNELTPSQHAPLLAHKLLTEESAEVRQILDKVILLMVPVTNPDGLQMITDWYRQNVGTEYEIAPYPGLYQKYSGHDNNRDWFMLNLPETRNVSKVLYQEWFPHIVYNQHQVAPFPARMFVPPYSEPLNPAIPAAVVEGISLIGQSIRERLALEGKPGAISYISFDGWWNGGMRTTPPFHNMHGILTETAGYYYATPYVYDPARFPRTFANGMPTDKPSIFYPQPWKGGRWSLGDAVGYNLTASMAVLSLAASRPEHWAFKAWRVAQDQIEAGKRGSPYAYVIPAKQWDPSNAQEMLRRLQANGVQVQRAEAAFTADGREYPAGSYVIPAGQPFRAYLMDLLEAHKYPEVRPNGGPVLAPYDSSGYTLAMQMGVDTVRVNDQIQGSFTTLTELPRPAAVLDRKQNASFWAIADALQSQGRVRLTRQGEFHGADAAEPPAWELRTPRVGMYVPYRSDMDGGWTAWTLDYYRVPYTELRNERVKQGNLRSQFDAIVIASQSTTAILHGYQPGVPTISSNFIDQAESASKSMMRPEFTGGIGMEGVVALREFVQQGGTLITFGAATELPISMFPLPVENTVRGGSFRAPGTIVRVEVQANDPWTAGLPSTTMAFVNGGYAFAPTAGQRRNASGVEVRSLVKYAREDLLASGWLQGENVIRGRDAVTEVRMGAGRVILFGIRPQHRAQTFGTFKLLLNALYMASAQAASGGSGLTSR